MKYRVWFNFCNLGNDSDFAWHRDFLDNNGKGFTAEEARNVAKDLQESRVAKVKNVMFEEMGTEIFKSEV